MPQVPYHPDFQGNPVSETPQVRLSLPGAAFGVNIGEALQHRGGALTEFGNDVYNAGIKLQSQTNEFEARAKVSDFQEQLALKQADFDSLSPQQQKDALPSHLAGLKQMRESFMGQLGAPEARLMFDRESQPAMWRSFWGSAGRAGDSYKRYMGEEGLANAERLANNWGNGSEGEWKSRKGQIEDAYDASAGHLDWGPEKVALKKQELISRAAMNSVLTKADLGDPEGALKALEQRRKDGDILEPHYRAAMDHANTVLATGDSRDFGIRLHQEGVSAEEARERIKEKAKAKSDNPIVQSNWTIHADQAYKGEEVYTKSIVRQQRQEHEQAWMEMLMEKDPNNPLGYKYNSVDDIRKDPQGKAIINSMDSKEQLTVDKAIATRILTRDFNTNQKTFQILKGMSHDDPRSFLQIDPYDPKLPLNWTDREKLLTERKALIRDPMRNRETQMASSWMLNSKYQGALNSLGLDHTPGAQTPSGTKDAYFQYKGIIREGIEAFKENNQGRPPTREEFLEKIAPNILKETTSSIPFLFGPTYTLGGEALAPLQEKVLNDTRQILSLEATKRNMPPPTDIDVQEYARIEQWKKILEIQGGKGAGTPKPGGPAPATSVP